MAKSNPPTKKKYIESPEKLWELFIQYIQWAKNNPYLIKDWVGGMGKQVRREKERPLSFIGFESWLFNNGIISQLGDYESNKDGNYEAYSTIITRIKKNIESDQFEGAASGIYHHNIIARKLGLIDKTENKTEVTEIKIIKG